jgi:hypothetical protein
MTTWSYLRPTMGPWKDAAEPRELFHSTPYGIGAVETVGPQELELLQRMRAAQGGVTMAGNNAERCALRRLARRELVLQNSLGGPAIGWTTVCTLTTQGRHAWLRTRFC